MECQRLTLAPSPRTPLGLETEAHHTSAMTPNTRSRAYDTSTMTLEQLASKQQRCNEEVEHERRLQTESYEHRRRLLKLEAEHELEHRRNIHQLDLEIRKSVNEVELRHFLNKIKMRLGYERASMHFREEFKRSVAGSVEGVEALARSEERIQAPNGVGGQSQSENLGPEGDESMVL